MRIKLFLSAMLVALSTCLYATNTGTTSTLKQIAGMLTPVECSVSDISSTAVQAAKVAKTAISISNQLNELKSSAESYNKEGKSDVGKKLQMLKLAQQLLSSSKSQTSSVLSLMSKAKNFSSLISKIKGTNEKTEAQNSANYCTKLLNLCNSESKSQISTATQIIKLLKAAK